jgi:hypothetical protein
LLGLCDVIGAVAEFMVKIVIGCATGLCDVISAVAEFMIKMVSLLARLLLL